MTQDRRNDDARDEPMAVDSGTAGVINAGLVAEDTQRPDRARPDPFGHRSEAANCAKVMGRRRHGIGDQGWQ